MRSFSPIRLKTWLKIFQQTVNMLSKVANMSPYHITMFKSPWFKTYKIYVISTKSWIDQNVDVTKSPNLAETHHKWLPIQHNVIFPQSVKIQKISLRTHKKICYGKNNLVVRYSGKPNTKSIWQATKLAALTYNKFKTDALTNREKW